jgi:hypothetical protein
MEKQMEKQKERIGTLQQDSPRLEQPLRSRALEVVIPYKTTDLTAAALEYAATLGHELNIRLRLIEVHVVPYALPLDKPSVRREHMEDNLRNIVEKSTLAIQPELVFARDWEDGFRRALRPRSVVVIPIQKSWWRSHDKRMAGRLRKHSHQVIWVECE